MSDLDEEDEWAIANYHDRVEHIQRGAEERTRQRQEAARARAAELSRREHTVQGARERYNEDIASGQIASNTPILPTAEGSSAGSTQSSQAAVVDVTMQDEPERKKRKATGAAFTDDGGAENDGNTDAEAAGFGLGRIRPLSAPKCPQPKALTRCYKKRMHFFLRPKTLKSLTTKFSDISTNPFTVAGIAFQDWIVIPWKNLGLYMNRFDFNNLKHGSLMYNYKSAKFNLSNFSTHQGSVIGTGTPQVTIQMSGVAFESVHVSSKEIGPWFVGQATTGVGNQITACTSFDFGDAFGFFDTNSLNNNPAQYYTEYPFKVIQVFRSAGDVQGQDQTVVVNNGNTPQLMVTNLSNYSDFGFAQPPISGASFKIKKKWRAGRFERPCIPRRVLSVGNVGNPNPFSNEFASGENITSTVNPGVVGSQIQKQGYIPTFRGALFSDYGENIAPNEFTTVSNYGNTAIATSALNPVSTGGNPFQISDGAFNEAQMMGFEHTGGDPQKDLFCFRIITPPNPISSETDPDITICFTLESECEVEYIPVVESTYTTRQQIATVNSDNTLLVESTDLNFFQAFTQFPDPIAYSIPNFNAQNRVFAMQAVGPRGTDMMYGNNVPGNAIGY